MNKRFIQDEVESDSKGNQSLGKRNKVIVPWDEMFARLKEFAEEHGHTNVSQRQGALGRWVCNQRARFRRLDKEKKNPQLATSLSFVVMKEKLQTRREALDKLGFGMSTLILIFW